VNVPIDGRMAILRTPTNDDPSFRVTGVVGDKYGLVQNRDLAAMLDNLIPEWPLETIGALGMGETIFFTLHSGASFVKGLESERLEHYFLVTDTRDGKTAIRIGFVPVRVVCQNTLSMALHQATVLTQLPHLENAEAILENRVSILQKLQKIEGMTLDSFNQLADAVLNPQAIAQVIEAAYPLPTKPKKTDLLEEYSEEILGTPFYGEITEANRQWEYYCERALAIRGQALERYARFNDESAPQVKETAWAVFNAVVENEDFRDGPQGLFESSLWGDRAKAKRRAFASALALSSKR
jgi:hypothetical protein